jgi:hypothetical protein
MTCAAQKMSFCVAQGETDEFEFIDLLWRSNRDSIHCSFSYGENAGKVGLGLD